MMQQNKTFLTAVIFPVFVFCFVFQASPCHAGLIGKCIKSGIKFFSSSKNAVAAGEKSLTGLSKTLGRVHVGQLPGEAGETIRRIKRGGPHPFDRDGMEFRNHEGLLPSKPSGYYSEYTVATPGTSGRGSRRIVSGRDGEMYYSDDHYNSFKQILD